MYEAYGREPEPIWLVAGSVLICYAVIVALVAAFFKKDRYRLLGSLVPGLIGCVFLVTTPDAFWSHVGFYTALAVPSGYAWFMKSDRPAHVKSLLASLCAMVARTGGTDRP